MPNLPNVHIDADLGSGPQRPYSIWDKARDEHYAEMEYLKKRASYTDPAGVMYFQDNYRYDPKSRTYMYPDGSPSDGLPPEDYEAPRDSLTNRYTLPPPPPAVLKNRYTLPTTAEKLQSAVPAMHPELGLLIMLADKAGYLK